MASATVRKSEARETSPQPGLHVQINLQVHRPRRPKPCLKLLLNVKRKFDLDPNILLCWICRELLSLPVYQCQNGHTVCSPCSEDPVNGCPSCSQPIGRIRCMTAEKIIESLTMTCKYAPEGCTEMLKLHELEKHEQSECKYMTVWCPMPSCTHEGVKLKIPEHLREEHDVQEVGTTETLGKFLGHTYNHKGDECCNCCDEPFNTKYVMVKNENHYPTSLSLVHVQEVTELDKIYFCSSGICFLF